MYILYGKEMGRIAMNPCVAAFLLQKLYKVT